MHHTIVLCCRHSKTVLGGENSADSHRDDGLHIQRNLDVFGKNLLSDDTLVTVLEAVGECDSW